MKNERKIGIVISYLNIIQHAVIGFIYVPLLLHYIGKSEYGLYQLIGSFIAYFSIMDFGLTAAVIRFYSRYKAVNDKVGMENILAVAARGYSIIALISFIAGIICYINLDVIFAASMTRAELATAKILFLLLLFNIVLTLTTMMFRAVINANEKFLFFISKYSKTRLDCSSFNFRQATPIGVKSSKTMNELLEELLTKPFLCFISKSQQIVVPKQTFILPAGKPSASNLSETTFTSSSSSEK